MPAQTLHEQNSWRSTRPSHPESLTVIAEQVSIFLTSDNIVIALFENSADDIEVPNLTRLNSPSTILQQSCDASTISQAIIDVIIDMAIPVRAPNSATVRFRDLKLIH
ncbi:hypothetical protein EDB81DRAFT_913351 [Dactylonectria macrodidyma]|uniref:Uncharacterized protein n=1 Tax=Dactylonectria macrodidyma TaxID=307937 RepID=A0A9P9DQE7_9HYPO|nr:hypothetical protein EDB81DRAFT_913351 [Dactylonectria macrodidyma]